MLKSILPLLGIILLLSCKKGEDDPFLSLRSRDGRLCRKWKLTEMSSKTDDSETKFDGTTLRNYHNGNLISESDYALSYVFKKNSNLDFDETKDGQTLAGKSEWVWTTTNKKKTGLIIDGNQYYMVTRLTSKELVLEQHYEFHDPANDDYPFVQTTLKFEKQ